MTKSTPGPGQSTAKGPKPATKRGEAKDKKDHLIVPDLNLGGGDDEEDDDFRPTRGFVPPTASRPTAVTAAPVPTQQREADRNPANEEVTGEEPRSVGASFPGISSAHDDSITTVTRSIVLPSAQDEPVIPEGAPAPVQDVEEDSAAAQEPTQGLPGTAPVGQSSRSGVGSRVTAERARSDVFDHSSDLARLDRSGNPPAVRASSSLSGLPARRPGRRRLAEPFNPDQPRQRNEAAMIELGQLAPGYASLLTVYSASQLNALTFENRNINLFGLTADQVGTQITADKALLKTLTLQRPKLTIAHYVDAALEPVLRPLDPEGVDMDAMEDERDYVWELARKGLAYRRYILSDQDSASMDNYRPVCSLRSDVNARLTRMMDLMDSIQNLQAKPFEIVSACLAEYVGRLPGERPHLTRFFQKHLVTTIQ